MKRWTAIYNNKSTVKSYRIFHQFLRCFCVCTHSSHCRRQCYSSIKTFLASRMRMRQRFSFKMNRNGGSLPFTWKSSSSSHWAQRTKIESFWLLLVCNRMPIQKWCDKQQRKKMISIKFWNTKFLRWRYQWCSGRSHRETSNGIFGRMKINKKQNDLHWNPKFVRPNEKQSRKVSKLWKNILTVDINFRISFAVRRHFVVGSVLIRPFGDIKVDRIARNFSSFTENSFHFHRWCSSSPFYVFIWRCFAVPFSMTTDTAFDAIMKFGEVHVVRFVTDKNDFARVSTRHDIHLFYD